MRSTLENAVVNIYLCLRRLPQTLTRNMLDYLLLTSTFCHPLSGEYDFLQQRKSVLSSCVSILYSNRGGQNLSNRLCRFIKNTTLLGEEMGFVKFVLRNTWHQHTDRCYCRQWNSVTVGHNFNANPVCCSPALIIPVWTQGIPCKPRLHIPG